MFTRAFWAALGERAIKTFTQAAAALVVAGATGLLEVNWVAVLSTAGLTTLASVLTTIGSGAATGGNASLASEVTVPAAEHEILDEDVDEPEGIDEPSEFDRDARARDSAD